MPSSNFHFICLNPRKRKEIVINATLKNIGAMTWRTLPPMAFRAYPEASARAEAAYDTVGRKPKSGIKRAIEIALLRVQYSGSRAFFEKRPDAIAVCWNGVKGTRRIFMDGAHDAGARTLYFESSPLAHSVTVDPCGVNYRNGLPRTAAPFLSWAREHGAESWREVRDTIKARRSVSPRAAASPDQPLTGPFVLVPLQVPGDSQLKVFGGAFRTVESVIEGVAEAARSLPDGWHMRLKEHPSSPIEFSDLIARLKHPKLVLDNATDTFVQVAAARAVITVNSSVGLEAMYYEKPVVALGEAFWAIPGIASHCPTVERLATMLGTPEALEFDPEARAAFLSFLASEYYPRFDRDGGDGGLNPQEAAKVVARLNGPSSSGFWTGSASGPVR